MIRRRPGSFEDLLSRTPSLSDRIKFIHALPPHSPSNDHVVVQKWCQEQETRAFESFNAPAAGDIPVLIEVARLRGLSFLVEVFVFLLPFMLLLIV